VTTGCRRVNEADRGLASDAKRADVVGPSGTPRNWPQAPMGGDPAVPDPFTHWPGGGMDRPAMSSIPPLIGRSRGASSPHLANRPERDRAAFMCGVRSMATGVCSGGANREHCSRWRRLLSTPLRTSPGRSVSATLPPRDRPGPIGGRSELASSSSPSGSAASTRPGSRRGGSVASGRLTGAGDRRRSAGAQYPAPICDRGTIPSTWFW
jgi:hypothetical protein